MSAGYFIAELELPRCIGNKAARMHVLRVCRVFLFMAMVWRAGMRMDTLGKERCARGEKRQGEWTDAKQC